MSEKALCVALAGNPNVGKTSLFNALTGARQHVGNWPGVTVEKKCGSCKMGPTSLEIVDLPGTYSLSAFSPDEEVARDYLVKGSPDVVVHVVDATNLERNLYLTLQIRELGLPVILALNMADIADSRGLEIDDRRLGENLGVRVVRTVASKAEGVRSLMEAICSAAAEGPRAPKSLMAYPPDVESAISSLSGALEQGMRGDDPDTVRAMALLLLENTEAAGHYAADHPSVREKVAAALAQVDADEMEMAIVDTRYAHIRGIMRETCTSNGGEARDATGMIDTVLTHKYLGIPIFLSLMWSAFMLTFTLAAPFMEAIDWIFGHLIGYVGANIANEQLASLLGDGILGGLGSVLIFVPNIFILFFLLSLLEDSGYLARATFVMDRLMTKIGLHGKSFVPMLMGFGCSVPAIMACRTIENKSDRMVTILSAPFITCGARLPVYVLFAGVYFGKSEGTVVFALYVLSIAVAILSAKLFRSTLFKGAPSAFIMELPEYRVPTLRTACIHMWERGSLYLRKAGTIIFVGVVVIWAFASFPAGVEYGAADSIIGSIGKVLEPLVAPLGFDWKIAVALIFGFVAKEIVIGALGVLYGTGEGEEMLSQRLESDPTMTALTSVGLMVFTLIYMPCIATVGVIKKETGSWKWAGFAIVYSTGLAWAAAFAIRHAGLALGY